MRYSINLKISVLFTLAFIFICTLFATLGAIENDNFKALQRSKAKQLINHLASDNLHDIKTYFLENDYKLIKNIRFAQRVFSEGEILMRIENKLAVFEDLEYNNSNFLKITRSNKILLFKNTKVLEINYIILASFLFCIVLIIFLYFSVLKSLAPLKALQQKIKKVARGEVDFVGYSLQQNNEIGEIAFEFDRAIEKIKELLLSRQLFLRTIMHELKTPIGKGRIIAELLEDDKQKERFIRVFARLDMLVNELAKVESVLSRNYNLNFRKYHFSLILEQAKEYLMNEQINELLAVNIIYDPILEVDLELFSSMLKNLIDNALKYSDDGRVEVISDRNYFLVKNSGKRLKHSFENYLKPFFREEHQEVGGMGLGLYIINHICNIQGFNLIYEYENNHHIFKVVFSQR